MTASQETKKTDPEAGYVSARTLVWWVGTLLGALAAMGTLHARFVIPTILEEARKMTREEVQSHASASTHAGAVPRLELEARFAAQALSTERVLDSINSRLARIEARLDSGDK